MKPSSPSRPGDEADGGRRLASASCTRWMKSWTGRQEHTDVSCRQVIFAPAAARRGVQVWGHAPSAPSASGASARFFPFGCFRVKVIHDEPTDGCPIHCQRLYRFTFYFCYFICVPSFNLWSKTGSSCSSKGDRHQLFL